MSTASIRTGCARGLLALAVLASVALTACSFSRPQPVRQTFLAHPVRPASAPTQAPLPGALLVGTFGVNEAYAGKPMVYRFSDQQFQSDFYNEFFVAPRDMVGQAVLDWLQAGHLYQTVAPLAGTRVTGARLLTGFVDEMYADVRDANQPRAVVAIQFYVTADAEPGRPALFAQQLRDTAPMRDSSAAAYAEALAQALGAVLAELEKQVRSTPSVR